MVFRCRMEKALNQLERIVLPPSGVAKVWHPVSLYCCTLMNLPAGGSQVYSPHDETRRGAAGNIRPFGERIPRKHRLLRFHTQ